VAALEHRRGANPPRHRPPRREGPPGWHRQPGGGKAVDRGLLVGGDREKFRRRHGHPTTDESHPPHAIGEDAIGFRGDDERAVSRSGRIHQRRGIVADNLPQPHTSRQVEPPAGLEQHGRLDCGVARRIGGQSFEHHSALPQEAVIDCR